MPGALAGACNRARRAVLVPPVPVVLAVVVDLPCCVAEVVCAVVGWAVMGTLTLLLYVDSNCAA